MTPMMMSSSLGPTTPDSESSATAKQVSEELFGRYDQLHREAMSAPVDEETRQWLQEMHDRRQARATAQSSTSPTTSKD